MLNCFISLFFLILLIKSQTIDDEILKIEKYVKEIALAQENLFRERCNTKCLTLSYHACSTIIPPLTCNSDFDILDCRGCNKPGRLSNNISSSVKLADVYQPYTNSESQNTRETICSSAGLDSTFQKNLIDSQGSIKWQFVGFYDGVFRTYPGRERCTQYDPRPRPWYVGAITGAKNLLMILDISGSMNSNNKLNIAKEAAIAVLNTLGNSDWIGLVVFSSTALKYNDKMIRANQENINKIKVYINSLIAEGQTNFEDAFRKGYEILTATVADEYGSGCNNIISFMTDGIITNGEQDKSILLNMLNQWDAKHNATIFTYAFGGDAEQEFLKSTACQHHGIFESVKETDDLLDAMLSYFRILSAGIQVKNVIWSEPYLDQSGLGLVTAASYPIYDRTDDPPLVIGVASIDILMDDFLKFEKSDQILKKLIQRSISCTKNVLNNCQFQSLRSVNAKCNNNDTNCKPLVKSPALCSDFPNKIFKEGTIFQKNNENPQSVCCESNGSCDVDTKGIIGGVVGGFCGFLVLTIISCVIYKKKLCFKNKYNEGNANNIPRPIPIPLKENGNARPSDAELAARLKISNA